MPLKSGAFTRQERAFVHHMTRSNDPTLAAQAAGYVQPASRGGLLMRRQDVVASVQAAVAHRLKTEGAEIGVGTLIDIAQDKKHPAASRVMAAKALVQLSGVGTTDASEEKALHTMSRAELVVRAEQARRVLAELDAPIIEHEEVPAGGVFD
jgi:hypothetical protein